MIEIDKNKKFWVKHYSLGSGKRLAGMTTGWRSWPYTLLEYTPDGSWKVEVEGEKPFLTKPGEVYLILSNRKHRLSVAPRIKSMTSFFVFFNIFTLAGENILLNAHACPKLPSSISDSCRSIFQEAVLSKNLPEESKIIQNQACAFLFFSKIQSVCKYKVFPRKLNEKISFVLDFIENNLHTEFTQSELAKIGCFSKSRLHAVFKETMGVSPRKYILQRRIDQAKELLLNSDNSISEIAYKCGFKSPLYFSRLFKQYVGTPPKSYKNNTYYSDVIK